MSTPRQPDKAGGGDAQHRHSNAQKRALVIVLDVAQVIGNVSEATHRDNELGEVIDDEINVDGFYVAFELEKYF